MENYSQEVWFLNLVFIKYYEYYDVVPARSNYNTIQKTSALYQENRIKDLLRDKILINMESISQGYLNAFPV